MGDGTAGTRSRRTMPARDWSRLPSDLLLSVFGLLEIRDLFSCAAVSLGWRAVCATARQLRLWPDQGPYLVYSSAHRDRGTATLKTSPPAGPSTPRSRTPPFRSCYIVGSSRGWLVSADKQSNLHLLNPVTGAQIALPPPQSMVGVSQSFSRSGDDYGAVDGHWVQDLDVRRRRTTGRNERQFFRPKKTRLYLYEKAVLSSDPSSGGGGCTVLLKHRPWEHLSFARVGDTKWTWLDTMGRCDHYHDFFYNNDGGLFYAIRASGDIHTIDLSGPHPVVEVIFKVRSSKTFYASYLARAPWGDLLRLRRLYGAPRQDDITEEENNLLDDASATGQVYVQTVDLAEQKVSRSRSRSLRDHVLFIGFNTTFMLPAKDFPNLTPNSVYMTDDDTEFIMYNPGSGRQMARVHLEDGTFSGLSLPDSQLDWPPTVWFTPSSSPRK